MAKIDNSFYIDKAGLALLLDSKNVSELYTLDVFGEKIDIDDDYACKTLFEMVSEQIITVEDEKFALCGDADGLISLVVDANRLLTAYSNQSDVANLAIYIGDKGACSLSIADNRPDYLKLQQVELDEILPFILEHFSIASQEKPVPIKRDVYIDTLELLGVNDDFEYIISSSNTDLFISLDEITHKIPIKRVAVIACEDGRVLAKWTKDGVELRSFTDDSIAAAVSDI